MIDTWISSKDPNIEKKQNIIEEYPKNISDFKEQIQPILKNFTKNDEEKEKSIITNEYPTKFNNDIFDELSKKIISNIELAMENIISKKLKVNTDKEEPNTVYPRNNGNRFFPYFRGIFQIIWFPFFEEFFSRYFHLTNFAINPS